MSQQEPGANPYAAPSPGYAPAYPPSYAQPAQPVAPVAAEAYAPPQPMALERRTGLAVAALIVSLVAAALCWLPFLGVVVALVGLVLGIVAWVQAHGGRRGGKGMAIAATFVGAGALLLSVLLTVLLSSLVGAIADCADPSFTDDQISQCVNDQFGG